MAPTMWYCHSQATDSYPYSYQQGYKCNAVHSEDFTATRNISLPARCCRKHLDVDGHQTCYTEIKPQHYSNFTARERGRNREAGR